MGISRDQFVDEIESGDRTDYVEDELLEWFGETADYEVIDRSATDKSDFSQGGLISVTTPNALLAEDKELVLEVQEKLVEGNTDIQKYQLRHSDSVAERIQIWRHKHGYTAFALAE